MTKGFERLRARLAGPIYRTAFLRRRRVLLTGAALCSVALGWVGGLRWRRAEAYTVDRVITALCDRMLPATGEHPGAVALGVHETIIEEFRVRGEDDYTSGLLTAAREARFLDLDPVEQDAALERLLDRRRDWAVARLYGGLLRRAVRAYLAHPGAWPALGYQKPQPLGYPDYADCRSAHGA